MFKFKRVVTSLLLIFIGFPAGYIAMLFLLRYIPVNRSYLPPKEGIEVFVFSNGMHTDFIVPAVSNEINWHTWVNPNDFNDPKNPDYMSIGWGDKGFYLDIPTWDDLTFSIAAKAILLPSPTAMHVTYIYRKPIPNKHTKRLVLTSQQYLILIEHIKDSFTQGTNDLPILINCVSHYNTNDNFYEANKSYHAFRTCNNWTNLALKKMSVKTSAWAPVAQNVMYHLR